MRESEETRGWNGTARISVSSPMIRDRFRYPNTVDENAARLIAGGVVLVSVAYLTTANVVLLAFLAYGFVARVLAGPSFSPLAQFVNRILLPWLSVPAKPVPGPPKRFAQGIGAVLSVGALGSTLAGLNPLATVLVALIAGAATLESVFAFCIGCRIFAVLMSVGLVPASVCEACSDLSKAPLPKRSSTGSSTD